MKRFFLQLRSLIKCGVKFGFLKKRLLVLKKVCRQLQSLADKNLSAGLLKSQWRCDPRQGRRFMLLNLDNPHGILKSGITNEIKILTYENPNAIIIPRNLVTKDETGSYVFIASNGKAQKKYITNGNESGMFFEISKGLNSAIC